MRRVLLEDLFILLKSWGIGLLLDNFNWVMLVLHLWYLQLRSPPGFTLALDLVNFPCKLCLTLDFVTLGCKPYQKTLPVWKQNKQGEEMLVFFSLFLTILKLFKSLLT